ncbi:MAG: hypothetical protein GX154_01200 [Clostridiales bacterium]|nr:hypothetical protein [Clostridiales bacterium]
MQCAIRWNFDRLIEAEEIQNTRRRFEFPFGYSCCSESSEAKRIYPGRSNKIGYKAVLKGKEVLPLRTGNPPGELVK